MSTRSPLHVEQFSFLSRRLPTVGALVFLERRSLSLSKTLSICYSLHHLPDPGARQNGGFLLRKPESAKASERRLIPQNRFLRGLCRDGEACVGAPWIGILVRRRDWNPSIHPQQQILGSVHGMRDGRNLQCHRRRRTGRFHGGAGFKIGSSVIQSQVYLRLAATVPTDS